MSVRLIPCRHRDTGAEADIPETALQHLPAFVPVDEADRKLLGYDEPADDTPPAGDAEPDGDQTPAHDDPPARKSKPATGAAKNTPKE